MLRFTQRLEAGKVAGYSLTLPFDQRIKGRLRVNLDDATPAGLFLNRGPILRDGDLIATDDGAIAIVRAAPEPVSTVRCKDPLQLARVCYHLGNRHTPVQIAAGLARYRQDPVLDDLVRALGLEPQAEQVPFEPEPGAYGEHGSDHAQGHSHEPTHAHGR